MAAELLVYWHGGPVQISGESGKLYWSCIGAEDYSGLHAFASPPGPPMSPAELTALLVFCTAMSFSPGPNTTLSTALAANLRPAPRAALLPGRAGRLDAADGGQRPRAWARWCSACRAALGGQARRRRLHAVAGLEAGARRPAGAGRRRRLRRRLLAGRGLQFVNIKAWMLALTLTSPAGWSTPPASPRPIPAAAGHHLRGDGRVRLHQQLSPMRWSARCCAAGWRRAAAALVQPRPGAGAGGHRRWMVTGMTPQRTEGASGSACWAW
jgi:hypothetical protein